MRTVRASSGARSRPRAAHTSCHDTGALARNAHSSSRSAAATDCCLSAVLANAQDTRMGVGNARSAATDCENSRPWGDSRTRWVGPRAASI